MRRRWDNPEDRESLRDRIIGLGEESRRKTYYPELQRRIEELERFRHLLDETGDGIFLLEDHDLRILDLNQAVPRLLGFQRDDLIGRTFDLVAGPTVVQKMKEEHPEAEGPTAGHVLTAHLQRQDGTRVPCEMTFRRVTVAGVVYTVAVARDVTERLRAEEAVRAEAVLHKLNEELEGRVKARTEELMRTNLLLNKARQHADKINYQARLQAEQYHMCHMRLRQLVKAVAVVLEADSIPDLLQRTVEAAREATESEYSVAGHLFVAGRMQIDATSKSDEGAPCPPGESFTMSRGGVYLEMMHGKILRLTQAELLRHPRWQGVPEGHAELRGLLGAPLQTSTGETKGFIMVSRKRDGSDYTPEDEEILGQLGRLASIGITFLEKIERINNLP